MVSFKVLTGNFSCRPNFFQDCRSNAMGASRAPSRAMAANIRSPLTRQHHEEPDPSGPLYSTISTDHRPQVSAEDALPR